MRTSGMPPMCDLPVGQARAMLAELSGRSDIERIELPEVRDLPVPVSGGTITVRVYRPEPPGRRLPAVLLFHGGGFIVGDLDTHDRMARYYAREADAVVVSVDYRLAPEHRFPTGVEDCYAALCWVAAQAGSLGIDPGRIAVTGDSAGGNLSAVVSLLARDRGGPAIALQALVYPAVDLTAEADWPSRREFAAGCFLTARDIDWVRAHYFADAAAGSRDPRASPWLAADLRGLPPALVVTAGLDPLRDEGHAYARRLSVAGVATEYRCFSGTIHGFLSFGGLLDAGREGLALVAARLRAALHDRQ
ncbi:MAG: alpha/beta hydrolase [Gammaproteobacteria bacterium]|nr:alpha/beta hydrolase [Gammaproteobacteria bacterium]